MLLAQIRHHAAFVTKVIIFLEMAAQEEPVHITKALTLHRLQKPFVLAEVAKPVRSRTVLQPVRGQYFRVSEGSHPTPEAHPLEAGQVSVPKRGATSQQNLICVSDRHPH